MDAVQIYTLILVGMSTITAMLRHGTIREVEYDFRDAFVALLLSLPFLGRVFNLW